MVLQPAEFTSRQRLIEDGSHVIIFANMEDLRGLIVTAKGSWNNRYGDFKLKDWIGKPFGTKVRPPLTPNPQSRTDCSIRQSMVTPCLQLVK